LSGTPRYSANFLLDLSSGQTEPGDIMSRRVLIAIAGLMIVALFGVPLIVATDPGETQLEKVGGSKSLMCRLVSTTRPIATMSMLRIVSRITANASCPTFPSGTK
jgi:hypothetical protein